MMLRSRLMLVMGIILLLVFLVTSTPALTWLLPVRFIYEPLGSFGPAIKKDPVGWLIAQHLQAAIGMIGLTLLGWAVAGQAAWSVLARSPTLTRNLWRQLVWMILAGQFASMLFSDLLRPFTPSLGHQGLLWDFLIWYGRVLPIAGLVVCLRLLYGRGAWRGDKWVGYVMAAVALFDLAWAMMRASGLGPGLFEQVGGGDAWRKDILNVVYLVFAAWTGLSLARPAETRRGAMYRSPAATGYAGAAALLLTFLWSLMTWSWVVEFLPGAMTWWYFGAFLLVIGWSLLCMLQALTLTHGEAVPAEAAAPERSGRMLRTLLRPRFWGELVLSLALSAGLLYLGLGAIYTVPIGLTPFVYPLLLFIAFVGPILVFVAGALRGRAGVATGALLLLLGVLGYRFANLQIAAQHADEAVAQASSLNILPPARPTKAHDIVLIRDSYFGRRDGAEQSCAAICQQILLNSSFAVAIADDTQKDWRVYRKRTGHDACMSPEFVDTYFDLLAAGIPDSCIAMTRQPPGKDALIIDEDLSHDSPVWKDIPRQFNGGVDEFYERVDGVDTLLGRAISGNVQPPLLSGQEAKKTPSSMRDFEFYALALQLPIAEHVPYEIEGLPAAVATLESLFDDPVLGTDAREAYRSLAIRTRDAAAADVIKASILRLWASADPERVKLGLATLYRIRDFDVAFAERFVVRYMASEDTDIMKAAVAALNAYSHDRIDSIAEVQAGFEFAKRPVGAVVLSERVTAYGDKYNSLVEILKRMPGSFPEDQRRAAMAQLKSRPDLTSDQRLVLLAVVARGSPEHRQEAVEWIFSLQGEPFERLLTAIRGDADVLAPDLSAKFWSDSEMEELVRRAADVPSERLMAYVDSIRFQTTFRDHARGIEDLIQDRVEALYSGSEADRKLAAKLEDFASRLRV